MSNAGLQPEAADSGDRSWPRRALPLVWLGVLAQRLLAAGTHARNGSRAIMGSGPLDGAGHRHPKFCEARDTIVTMKPEDEEERAMGDVECGQNAVHESKGAFVPRHPTQLILLMQESWSARRR